MFKKILINKTYDKIIIKSIHNINERLLTCRQQFKIFLSFGRSSKMLKTSCFDVKQRLAIIRIMNTLSASNILVILLEQLSENEVDFWWQVASCLFSSSFYRMIVIEFTKPTTDLTHRRNVIRFSYRTDKVHHGCFSSSVCCAEN